MAWQNISKTNFEEKMMWVGVMRRAIFDYVLYKGKGKYEIKWKKAYQYLFCDPSSTSCDSAELSFEQTCGLFGWDPEYIRRLIKKLDRPDIHRLEATRFKDDFRNDTTDASVPDAPISESTTSSVPIFVYLIYGKDYRKGLKPEVVYQESLPVTRAPLIQWGTM